MKLDDTLLPILYMLAAMGFILAIKWMNSPATARRGVIVGEIGMLLAVVGTLLRFEVVNYQWILVAFFLGTAVGIPIAYIMPMTAVPQRTAFSHACGALASALIGTAEYYKGLDQGPGLSKVVMIALIVETLLGFLTFTASMMAFGKLQEVLAQRPITYKGQNFVNLGVFAAAAGVGLALIVSPERSVLFPIFAALALLFGVLLIIPIGGADMPTVIALLNSYAGLVGQRDGICAEQQAADRGRRAGWIVRVHSFDHHVPGHEPVVHQRAVRRVRPVADQRGRGGRGQTRAFGNARRRGADSGFGAQRGGDSGLRNGRGAGATQAAGNVRYADASAAWTCGLRFIPWRAACPAT